MPKPVLLVLAAGLGSRYGGLKQIAPVDSEGHIIIDYSLYDARQAGFETVICVITPQLEHDFRDRIGDRVSKHLDLRYAYQLQDSLPQGYSVPNGRTKPWGTAHAALSAEKLINGPFAVINADDLYGAAAFRQIYEFLQRIPQDNQHAMVGYRIENTLTEHGHVARGVCTVKNGQLLEIVERTHIEPRPNGAAFTEDGENFAFIPEGTYVSMNMWGFGPSMMPEIKNRFSSFLAENLPSNPLKCEYFLPSVPNDLLREGKAEIKVLPTAEKWHGVTYAQDMPGVRAAISKMKADRIYPKLLWGGN